MDALRSPPPTHLWLARRVVGRARRRLVGHGPGRGAALAPPAALVRTTTMGGVRGSLADRGGGVAVVLQLVGPRQLRQLRAVPDGGRLPLVPVRRPGRGGGCLRRGRHQKLVRGSRWGCRIEHDAPRLLPLCMLLCQGGKQVVVVRGRREGQRRSQGQGGRRRRGRGGPVLLLHGASQRGTRTQGDQGRPLHQPLGLSVMLGRGREGAPSKHTCSSLPSTIGASRRPPRAAGRSSGRLDAGGRGRRCSPATMAPLPGLTTSRRRGGVKQGKQVFACVWWARGWRDGVEAVV